MTTKTAYKKTRTYAEIINATIVREGKSPKTGKEMLVLRFADGGEGALNREYVRKISVEAGQRNRALLASLGFKSTMSVVAGVFSSQSFEDSKGHRVSIEGKNLSRITPDDAKSKEYITMTIMAFSGVR